MATTCQIDKLKLEWIINFSGQQNLHACMATTCQIFVPPTSNLSRKTVWKNKLWWADVSTVHDGDIKLLLQLPCGKQKIATCTRRRHKINWETFPDSSEEIYISTLIRYSKVLVTKVSSGQTHQWKGIFYRLLNPRKIVKELMILDDDDDDFFFFS